MAKTLPVVIALFIFFPRMAPLWSVPLVSGEARTGISDTMTPGDISSLAQSSERAFRVSFGGNLPEHRDRYWRGLILDRFDGTTWTQWQEELPTRPGRVNRDPGSGGLAVNEYDVLMEASGQPWVYALDDSRPVSANVEEVAGGLFRLRRPADTDVGYRLALDPDSGRRAEEPLAPDMRRRYLQLPDRGNPRARELVASLSREYQSDGRVALAIMNRFREQPYYYTLRPPAMPDDPVDALLFDARRGFCAHYASATAFLLRSAGIPARVVVGYQGGSAGADNAYLIVRQFDAHAWVEAWIKGQGWVRLDPTAMIAPERIESGLRDAMAEEGSFLENEWASPERYGDLAMLQWASLQLDRVNYNWQRWVVGYQGQSQLDLMGRLPGNLGFRELGYLTAGMVGFALLVAGVIATLKHRGQRGHDPVARLMDRWARLLRRVGVEVPAGATPDHLAELTSRHAPGATRLVRGFARDLNNYYYGPEAAHRPKGRSRDAGRRQTMKRRLNGVKRELRRQGRTLSPAAVSGRLQSTSPSGHDQG
ncbi:transglutaminase family protein [Marinobacter daqiaonensis]|uniref:transglutaminase family protein n=1 Tax=Marinobacter daqiaonensis TaxID=650891 RepID=UPI0022310DF3|nr:DUF3488 and transglutaminase-like domain-containing protein [Marinobacter daqiaonensis]